MTITIEISNTVDVEKILAAFRALNIGAVRVIGDTDNTPVARGDKSLDPTALFGIWQKNPRSLTTIRSEAWKRKDY